MTKHRTTLLVVLDGVGLNPRSEANAVAMARKPTFDALWRDCAHTTLTTFGERVGLPAGQMGNSEVGHLNIGAGRVVEQWLLRISRALQGEFLNQSGAYQAFLKNVQAVPTIHLIGLLSDGGVHSHEEHLRLLILRLLQDTRAQLAIHIITDGRDTAPRIAAEQIATFERFIAPLPRVQIASVIGRFFAMDRDKRWERTEHAYRTIVLGEGARTECASAWAKISYTRDIADEFIEPAVLPGHRFSPEDAAIFWNFRADRMRQIVPALALPSFQGFSQSCTPLDSSRVLCFTEYDATFKLPYLFDQLSIRNHLGAVLATRGDLQLRVAETEKYPHVTYFLNGGIEEPLPGEKRVLIPSPRDVKTYDLKPEMSAEAVCDAVLEGINQHCYSLIVVNFANGDMVGHTGVLPAAIRAVETVDRCLQRIVESLTKHGGQALIIADHGNCEQMLDYETGEPHTSHTTYPVPAIMLGHSEIQSLRNGGALCDVAPTVLKMMGIQQPTEMTGQPLF